MSGFVALLSDQRRDVDEGLLANLTQDMAYRGPDQQEHLVLDFCGLGHTLLDTSDGRRLDPQPRRLDDLYLVADARLDDRPALARRLGEPSLATALDSELLLHAYRRWGSACAEHLVGDFAFVIWDRAEQRLFAARDPLGIRPFYFAVCGRRLILGNTLRTLRRHLDVGSRLNDLAVADFLLFGANQDLSTTAFAQIQRLPPAHLLLWQPGDSTPTVRRYSRLEARSERPPRRFDAAVDEYRELLRQAVEDRLTSDRAAIFLSGGLDSPSVAALVGPVLGRRPRPVRFEAFTAVYRRLIDDPEEDYARAVAEHLGLSHHLQPVDDYRLFEAWEERFHSAEPVDGSMLRLNDDLYRQVTEFSRLAFTGDGADPALIVDAGDFWRQLRGGRLNRVGSYLWQALRHGRRPPLGLRSALRRRADRRHWRQGFPAWLRPELVRRLDLEERWRQVYFEPGDATGERSEALQSLLDPLWVAVFEAEDPGSSGFAMERRMPFFDLRLLRFCLSLPGAWCRDKRLLRAATSDLLPTAILDRPKTPLAGNPQHPFAKSPKNILAQLRVANGKLMEYLDADAVHRVVDCSEDEFRRIGVHLIRSLALAYWIDGLATD